MATLVVKRSIMHRYQSIGQAIEEAMPGDMIEIRDGIYEESLDISKRLTLYGVGNVTIKGGVFIRYQTHVDMRNLRFRQGQGLYVKGDLQLENCVIEEQLIRTQIMVSYGSLLMKNCAVLATPLNHFGLRVANGSSVILVDTTLEHHVKAQIIAQNCEMTLSNCLLLEGKKHGIFAIRHVRMVMEDCEIHGHEKEQIVAASSELEITNCLIHQGQGVGIQLFDDTILRMEGCEINNHQDTNMIVHRSEVMVSDSIFSDGQGLGLYLGEKTEAKFYDCQFHRHVKAQMLIENSKAEFRKCHIHNGMAVGMSIVDEADVSMTECQIQNHQQFHIIVDASGLQLHQSTIQFGQSGGIYGNDHAKIMLHHTNIRELERHHVYINNARLFTQHCTFEQMKGNGITCIDAIFEVANSHFKDCRDSTYAIMWSDRSMGRIEHCQVDEAARPFLALSNQSLLEIRDTDLSAVKAPAVVQENSQLYVQKHVQTTTWHKDTTSRVSQIETVQTNYESHIEMLKNDIKKII
ncbi:right-handed parallel beta-helix repeat-containing protein [Lysinibacillus fusiformis]|uniref:right-handed parallel beta-helix repeat-containing protein n=1 Tax=Lysinibacillus fusiformis TaxID=28031 RepID=UPI00215AB572|nr:right-handed parallel beta-helix repeat-containing protein [Lysinibacillus fusiformis]MCR8852426.1 right-handed parallel beta-helix repeat-containing protein [Lysinibacillus fusiformis]WKT78907.1 right-handed parallel beta-helix repeat-containing protein [Lysinibacillus fusiformis]